MLIMNYFLFGNIPSEYISLIGPFVLIIIGYLVEKNFVGRIATFTNSIAVNLAFYGKDLSKLGQWQLPLIVYLDIGLIIGIIAILAYQQSRSLFRFFYQISWVYSSIVVGFIVLFSLTLV